MKTGLYVRLGVNNIRKNGQIYLPYILACTVTVTIFYLVKSLSLNPGISQMSGSETVSITMGIGSSIIGLFALIFLFYTNSFLIKRRKKEFGLFNILGMEKKHLAKVLLCEALLTAILSLWAGVLLGIALDKAMFLLIAKVIGAEVVLGFFISVQAIQETIVFFCITFFLIYLRSVYTVGVSKPIELLHGSKVGEKEPKANWLLALLGAVLLGVGYYLALTIQNPIVSVNIFFQAVLLVIIATYLLFTAGSIALLKLMRKNQRFYYRANHFISVSGMLYRMKQNAVGLANICILSTMVLIMISSTSSMMVGIEDIIRTRYPNTFSVYSDETDRLRNEEFIGEVEKICQELEVPVTGEVKYTYVNFLVSQEGDFFVTDETQLDLINTADSLRLLMFVPLSEYNASAGETKQLQSHETLFFPNRGNYTEPIMRLFGKEYGIAERLKGFLGNGISESNIVTSYFCVLRDDDFAELLRAAENETGKTCKVEYYYGFDTAAGESRQGELLDRILNAAAAFGLDGYVESRVGAKASFLGLYGGLFFLGVFLGILFTMATVLIIYYKQISEGYEDRERFVIMQKVGMTQGEVKGAIRSQVLTVFFLPLLVAGIHVAVAFPLISHVLTLFNMVNVTLYLICTFLCFLLFMVMYIMIYSLTAKTYYKIVVTVQPNRP